MRRIISLICALALALCLGLAACDRDREEDGDDGPTWREQYHLGVRYLEDGNYEEAIIAFTAAIEIDPDRADAYVGRGQAYIGAGEPDSAAGDFEKALELEEDNREAWQGLVDAYTAAGDDSAARDALERSRDYLDGDDVPVLPGETPGEDPGEDPENGLTREEMEDLADRVLEHEEDWGPLVNGNTAYFLDLYVDGTPELVVEEPGDYGRAIRHIYFFHGDYYQINSGGGTNAYSGPLVRWRDRDTGELFYVGYKGNDTSRHWRRLDFSPDFDQTYLFGLDITGTPGGPDFSVQYFDERDRETTREGYEALRLAFEKSAEILGVFRGEPFYDWDTNADGAAKRQRLLDILARGETCVVLPEDCLPTDASAFPDTQEVLDNGVVDVRFDHGYSGYNENATISGLDAQGNAVWTYNTPDVPAAQLEGITPVGINGGRYYFTEYPALVALDLQTGEVLWRNEEVMAGSALSAFAPDGSVLVSGYFGPDFMAVSPQGETLICIGAFSPDYYWPGSLQVQGDRAVVTLTGGDDGYDENGVASFWVDLTTWQYGQVE